MEQDDFFIEDLQADNFITTKDGILHSVVWENADDTDYPVWYCVTHKKHYYRECI